jgi:hypothetical protein
MAVRLSAPCTGHTLLPGNIKKNVSGTHFCSQGLVGPEELGNFKISLHQVSNLRPYCKICNLLNRSLQEFCGFTPNMILNFFL